MKFFQVADDVLDRRAALTRLGAGVGFLGSALLLGCGGSDGGETTPDAPGAVAAGSSDAAAPADGGACEVTPEGEIGPYFADDSATGFHRSNIVSNLDGTEPQAGIPLALTIYVYDAENGCAALAGAQVDIWHCNADGVYSDIAAESTTGQQWLRGYQLTDASGKVAFTTVFPGWYQGRTTHIHVRVRSSYSEASTTSDGTNTTQLFFPQALVNTVDTTVAPYKTEGVNSTTNASDRVYTAQTGGKMELALTGSTTVGYATTVSIYLPITAA